MTKPLVSVVVPVFNETEVLEESYTRMRSAMEAMTDVRYELIYVDDGSSDDTYARLAKFAKTDPLLRVIKFSRNFGHQIAITAGIDLAMGDAVVVIDADLQDPPEVIADFVAKWQEGYHSGGRGRLPPYEPRRRKRVQAVARKGPLCARPGQLDWIPTDRSDLQARGATRRRDQVSVQQDDQVRRRWDCLFLNGASQARILARIPHLGTGVPLSG